jgi:hypothetical protein
LPAAPGSAGAGRRLEAKRDATTPVTDRDRWGGRRWVVFGPGLVDLLALQGLFSTIWASRFAANPGSALLGRRDLRSLRFAGNGARKNPRVGLGGSPMPWRRVGGDGSRSVGWAAVGCVWSGPGGPPRPSGAFFDHLGVSLRCKSRIRPFGAAGFAAASLRRQWCPKKPPSRARRITHAVVGGWW